MLMKRLIPLLLVLVTGLAQAQVTVRGTVTSAVDGRGIPGVTVQAKGSNTGTATDMDGGYTLSVSSGDVTLVFRSLGFKTQEIVVGNRTTVDVVLEEDLASLEEFVVVGYGTMRKKDMTSAHVSIGSEDIERTVNTTIEQALQGRAAGVYVTQNTGDRKSVV